MAVCAAAFTQSFCANLLSYTLVDISALKAGQAAQIERANGIDNMLQDAIADSSANSDDINALNATSTVRK